MKNLMGRLFAILAIAMFVMACGDDKDKGVSCEDGELYASVGGVAKCYQTCEQTSDCATPSTMECRGTPKLCLDKAIEDTDAGNNGDEDTGPGETPAITKEHEELCEDYCAISYGCIYEWCGENNIIPGLIQSCLFGFEDQPGDTGCIGELTGTSADAARIEAAAEEIRGSVYRADGTKATCEDTEYLRCVYGSERLSCGCEASTKLGDACEKPEDCESGSLLGACIAETTESGQETGYPGGYCLTLPCDLNVPAAERIQGLANPNSLGCGVGNYCIYEPYDGSTNLGFCYASCQESSECREGYVCGARGSVIDEETETETMAKTCVPAGCSADTDCGTGANQGRCNLETKACEFRCNSEAAIAFCESGNGECTGEEDGPTFCTLP